MLLQIIIIIKNNVFLYKQIILEGKVMTLRRGAATLERAVFAFFRRCDSSCRQIYTEVT